MLREEIPGITHKNKQKIIIDVNSYKLGNMLGQGTFGKVFQAVDTKTGEKVAIKEVYQDKRYKNRQLDVISRLDHDNIIYMKDYYFINRKEENYLYLVMDFYETNLQALLKQQRKKKTSLEPKIRKIYAFQLFKALYYLKNNNVCHRDLKPPNILIKQNTNELCICDFGSAKIFDKNQKNVAYICSRYYRAPELLFEYSKYQTQIDVWSAGCIMAQFLTCEPIFPGDSSLEQLIEIIKIIGTPSMGYLEKYAKQIKQQITFPKIPNAGWLRLFKKYKAQPQFIDLISKILVYDLQQRYTPLQVLMHPYFHDLKSEQYKQDRQKLPNLFDFDRLRTPKNAKNILLLQQLYMKSSLKENMKQDSNIIGRQQEKLETGDCTPQTRGQKEDIKQP